MAAAVASSVNDATVAAAAAGDSRALAAVYAALAPGVLGYLRAHGAEDPEGLTNEVFLQVMQRLPDGVVGGATGLRTFVFSVAHARLVDDLRRRSRRPGELPYEAHLDSRHEPSAEQIAMSLPGGSHLLSSLSELNHDQRSVISLRVLGDLSIEQTAEVLGKSPGAIKQLQRRGLLRLRALLDDEEGSR